MDNHINHTTSKIIRRRRSDCAWRKSPVDGSTTSSLLDKDTKIYYPPGPIHIVTSWNPVNKSDKPPYSYATIIGHAILTSKERKLTLNDIYVWITENYPFYSNDTQGWQNSIRHNLSLHKAFVKIERDSNTQNNPPRKGCFWTIRPGKEKSFIDNLQKPVNSVRKQHSMSHLGSSPSAAVIARRQQLQRRASSISSANNINTTSDHRLFNPLRGTVTSTSTTSVPEAEPNNNVVTSSSSSSDHNQSPILSSNTSSPIYHQSFMPESSANTTYNVYPDENHEVFHTSIADDLRSYAYSTTSSSYLTDHPPPSLSPCGAYSTTSSSFADNSQQLLYTRSQDHNRIYDSYTGEGNTNHSLYLPKGYPHTGSYSPYSNSLMDWSSSSQPSSQHLLKHENMLYHTNHTTVSPPYYYMQQQPQSRLASATTSDFSSFFHR